MMKIALALLLLAAPPALDGAKIEKLTGLKGTLDAKSGTFKVSAPRSDLAVTVNGVHITPAMGLTSWIAFHPAGKDTMAMGDLVLVEDQVNPVMSLALEQGFEVTALHNHFFWDSPKVMFMHVGGKGSEEMLASVAGKLFAKIAETSGGKGETLRADIDPAKSTLDPKKLETILGAKGDTKDGVTKFVFGRSVKIGSHEMGAPMGVNTWAAFAGSDDIAVVDGDFAMHESEMQDVLKALRAAKIDVVAIHQHMVGETPRTLFLHYWGIGKTSDLAAGLKAALAKTKD